MNEVEFKQGLAQLYDVAFKMKEYTSGRIEGSLLTDEALDGLLQYLKSNILSYGKMKKMSDTPEHKIVVSQVIDIILDYATDVFVENKRYQEAYFVLNEWNKKIFNLTGKVSAFSMLKLACVRCIAAQENMEVDLKNNPRNKLRDTYKNAVNHISVSLHRFKTAYLKFVQENSSLSQENRNFLDFLRIGLLEDEKIDSSWLREENINGLIHAVNEGNYDVLYTLSTPVQLATEGKFESLLMYADELIELNKPKRENEIVVEFVEDERTADEGVVIEEAVEEVAEGPIQEEAEIEIVEEAAEEQEHVTIVEEPRKENANPVSVESPIQEPPRPRRRRQDRNIIDAEIVEESGTSGEKKGKVTAEKTKRRRQAKTVIAKHEAGTGEGEIPSEEQVVLAGVRPENGGKTDMQEKNVGEKIEVDVEATIIAEHEELKLKLENMPDNSPEYLYTVLQVIEVIYKRMRLLDKKIADKETELENVKSDAIASIDEKISQFNRVLEERSEGVNLAGIREGLENKIKNLEARKKQIKAEMEARKDELRTEIDTFQTQKNTLSDEYGKHIEDSQKIIEEELEIGDE